MASGNRKTTKNSANENKPSKAKSSKKELRPDLGVDPKNRRDNFIRLAELRSHNAIKAIQLIGNLSNVNDYEFTENDVETIMAAIKTELQATESRFKVSMQRTARKPVKLAA